MPILGKFSISKSALKSYCPKLAEGYPRALLKRAYVDQILVMYTVATTKVAIQTVENARVL
ncbi:Uncharacterised protein [Shewanella putrefaciens]|uniref:Uncharacterized protein n=1 Tax=Shewanella putrefaciens (strain 200) TaxID=399804 RepID=E6XIZ0_SHEP2|nr:hypothetical protein SHEWT2_00646 [Shewanella hafniensis]SUI57616.1 Uncharacterised protein [Shewanella putrefaciens]